MSSIQTKLFSKPILVTVALSLALFYFSSCAQKVNFQSSSVVPAARGDVKVKKDNNNNYNIQISVSHLAEPEKLQPSRNTYVVWMEDANNATKNIGKISSSTGFLTGKLKASFETTTSTKPTKIFLTAEDDAGIEYPGSQVILSTSDF